MARASLKPRTSLKARVGSMVVEAGFAAPHAGVVVNDVVTQHRIRPPRQGMLRGGRLSKLSPMSFATSPASFSASLPIPRRATAKSSCSAATEEFPRPSSSTDDATALAQDVSYRDYRSTSDLDAEFEKLLDSCTTSAEQQALLAPPSAERWSSRDYMRKTYADHISDSVEFPGRILELPGAVAHSTVETIHTLESLRFKLNRSESLRSPQ